MQDGGAADLESSKGPLPHQGYLLLVEECNGRGGNELPPSSVIRALIPFMRAPSSSPPKGPTC